MEKTLVTLACGCTYKTFDNCTCDNTYCETHQAERDAQALRLRNLSEVSRAREFLLSTDYKIVRQFEQQTMSAEAYQELLSARQAARDRINELEA